MTLSALAIAGVLIVAVPAADVDELRARSSAALAEDDLERAIGLLREVVSSDPQPTDVKLLADALAWSGELEEACALYRELREVAPNDPKLRLAHAYALSWSGDREKQRAALELMETHLAERPDDSKVQLARAQILSWLGRIDEAVAAFEAYLERHPGDATAKLSLAKALRWSERMDGRRRADRVLRGLLADEPSNVEAQQELDLLDRELRPVVEPSFGAFLDSSPITAWSSGARVSVVRSHRLRLGGNVQLWSLDGPERPSGSSRLWAQRFDVFGGYELTAGLLLEAGLGVRTQSDDFAQVRPAGFGRVTWAFMDGAEAALAYGYDDLYADVLQPRAAIDRIRGSRLALDFSWQTPWALELQAQVVGRQVRSEIEASRRNRSLESSLWVGYELLPGLAAGYRGGWLHWGHPDPAYWSPDLYHGHFGEVRLTGDHGSLSYGGDLRLGATTASVPDLYDTGFRFTWAGGLRIDWRPIWWLRLGAEVQAGQNGQRPTNGTEPYWWLSSGGTIGLTL